MLFLYIVRYLFYTVALAFLCWVPVPSCVLDWDTSLRVA